MIYQGIFEDINGQKHLLRVGSTGDTVTLKFGGSPFVTSMDASDGVLYKPVKCQAGTIGLIAVDTDYMFGLYTGDAHGMPVTLYRGSVVNSANIEWVGYVTPSLYDIGYTKYLEALDVDCVDGLATLEQYKYKPVDSVNGAAIVTLLDLMRHCIQKAGCYTMMVMSTATKLSSTDTRDLWQSCHISERNFLNQDTDAQDGEDDKTYKEVLEAVCMWMGVTCVANGDTVYFVDYDALANPAKNTSIIVDVNTGTVTTGTMAVTPYSINAASYASSGTQLSLDSVYRKVSIKCELNEYENVLGDIFDGATNITAHDPLEETAIMPTSLIPGRGCEYSVYNSGDNILWMCDKVSNSWNALFLKYYKPKHATLYQYNAQTPTSTYQSAVNFTNTKTINGAFMARANIVQLSETDPLDYGVDIRVTLDGLLQANDIHTVSYKDYLFMLNHGTNHIANADTASFPYFQSDGHNATALFGGARCKLLITGTIYWHSYDDYPYPVPDGELDPGHGSDTCPANDGYILSKLQWGGMYWSGRAWQSSATTFKLPYMSHNQRYDEVMFRSQPVKNTVSWRLGLDEGGYVITMPNDSILYGTPILTLYKPTDMGSRYNTTFMAIENLRIKPVTTDPNFAKDSDEDTVYTNIIDTGNAEEMDEVTMNVCTWDNKRPNFSAVAYDNGTSMLWVDKVYHTVMAADEAGDTLHDGTTSDGHQRQEEHLLHRLVNQYSEPAKVLTIDMHENIVPTQMVSESNLNAAFILDSKAVDYRQQKYSYRLIEKR